MVLAVACTSPTNKPTQVHSDSADTKTVHDYNDNNGFITFKADGKKISIPLILTGFARLPNLPKQLVIIGVDSRRQKEMIQLSLMDFHVGDYTITEDLKPVITSGGTYFPDCSNRYDAYMLRSGRISITSFDTVAHIFNGRFSGVFKRVNDDKPIIITNGLIKDGRVSVL